MLAIKCTLQRCIDYVDISWRSAAMGRHTGCRAIFVTKTKTRTIALRSVSTKTRTSNLKNENDIKIKITAGRTNENENENYYKRNKKAVL